MSKIIMALHRWSKIGTRTLLLSALSLCASLQAHRPAYTDSSELPSGVTVQSLGLSRLQSLLSVQSAEAKRKKKRRKKKRVKRRQPQNRKSISKRKPRARSSRIQRAPRSAPRRSARATRSRPTPTRSTSTRLRRSPTTRSKVSPSRASRSRLQRISISPNRSTRPQRVPNSRRVSRIEMSNKTPSKMPRRTQVKTPGAAPRRTPISGRGATPGRTPISNANVTPSRVLISNQPRGASRGVGSRNTKSRSVRSRSVRSRVVRSGAVRSGVVRRSSSTRQRYRSGGVSRRSSDSGVNVYIVDGGGDARGSGGYVYEDEAPPQISQRAEGRAPTRLSPTPPLSPPPQLPVSLLVGVSIQSNAQQTSDRYPLSLGLGYRGRLFGITFESQLMNTRETTRISAVRGHSQLYLSFNPALEIYPLFGISHIRELAASTTGIDIGGGANLKLGRSLSMGVRYYQSFFMESLATSDKETINSHELFTFQTQVHF